MISRGMGTKNTYPLQVSLRQSLRWMQKNQYLKNLEPNQNSRGIPIIIQDSTDPVFGYSSGDPYGIPSDNTTKVPHPVPIIKLPSVQGETRTKNTSHVKK